MRLKSMLLNTITILSYSLLFPVLIVINAIVLLLVYRSKKIRGKPAAVFLVCLSVSHIVQGALVMPAYIATKTRFSPFLCDLFRFTYMITFYGSCINVMLMSVDRFLASYYIFSYRLRVTRRAYICVCAVAWCYMVIICALPFHSFEKHVFNMNSRCTYNTPRMWTISMLTINTLIPYIIIISSYIYIIKVLSDAQNKCTSINSHFKVSGATQDVSLRQFATICPVAPVRSQRDKVTELTFKVSFLYLFTWAPSIVYYLLISIDATIFSTEFYRSDLEAALTFVMKFLTFFDGALSPVVYCYYHHEFHKEGRRLLGKIKQVLRY